VKNSVALDPFDLAILRILQKDNTVPQRVIAERVNLSAPSIQRRIKRLEASGIIAAQTAIVNPARFGRALTIVVQVELNVETGGAIDLVKQSFVETPEIQQCYYVTGEADFVLIILVQDMSEYEALTQRLFFSNETIKKFKTFVTMDRTKVSLEIDI
jgi:DNA-binding Lrp family transcriptional regulator